MKTHAPQSASPILAPVPLGIARSALFAVAKPAAQDARARPVPIAPYRGASLTQTGPGLGQHHALAWQAVIYWANDAGIQDSRPFTVAADELLRLLGGKGGDSAQRYRLGRTLIELAATRIVYRTDFKAFEGPLLAQAGTDARGWPMLALPQGWQELVRTERLRNDLTRKRALGRHALALWLHDFIATHLRPPPETVETLRQWSGAGQDLAHFRHDLRMALRRLAPKVASTDQPATNGSQPALGALVLDWRIDRRDRLHIDKAQTDVYLGEDKVRAAPAHFRQQGEVHRARMQRARVAL